MKARFNLRTAGVAVHEGRVLIHRSDLDPFWSLPGGRIELREPSTAALKREMVEELGVEVTVGRLLWVAEYFFTYGDTDYHEFAFYFSMQLPAGSPLLSREGEFRGQEKTLGLRFRWQPLDRLGEVPLLPRFLREKLIALPVAAEYVFAVD